MVHTYIHTIRHTLNLINHKIICRGFCYVDQTRDGKKTISLSFTWLVPRTEKKKKIEYIEIIIILQSLQLFRPCILFVGDLCLHSNLPYGVMYSAADLVLSPVRMADGFHSTIVNICIYLFFSLSIWYYTVESIFVGRIYILAPLHWIINRGGYDLI